MQAITICQPYASLIIGWPAMPPEILKRVENRTWPTRYRGPLVIDAIEVEVAAHQGIHFGLAIEALVTQRPAVMVVGMVGVEVMSIQAQPGEAGRNVGLKPMFARVQGFVLVVLFHVQTPDTGFDFPAHQVVMHLVVINLDSARVQRATRPGQLFATAVLGAIEIVPISNAVAGSAGFALGIARKAGMRRWR